MLKDPSLLSHQVNSRLSFTRVNQTIDSIIKEIKVESEKKRKLDRERRLNNSNIPGRKVSKRSLAGNPESYFQFFRQIVFKKEVILDHPALLYNSFPVSVRMDTKLVKVHYLFEMLGTSWIFVRGEKEHLKGQITKQCFLNLRYSLQVGL